MVVDGIAYFTANDHSRRPGVTRTGEFPCVVAFDTRTFKKVRSYDFGFTYDSSPLVYPKRNGDWLVIAHEYKLKRTAARNRDTGELEWVSQANQPGNYFFGYTHHLREDGSRLLLMACMNGLHALSGEDGSEVWWLKRPGTGGVTPCVDQERGLIYYQQNGRVFKLRAEDGEVLAETGVAAPNRCISWNTVLIDDEHGYHVATRWYGKPEWDSAIRVYDENLNLRWERTGLPNGKKDTLTYFEGKLICGSGNGWSTNYTGTDWKHITAFAVDDGREVWKCDLSDQDYNSILNLPCFNGFLYAENSGRPPQTAKCFRINAATGKLEEVYDYGRPVTSCAAHIIAGGRILSGDLWEDSTVVTQIAEGARGDWPGPFGDPQTHQMTALREPAARLSPIAEVGRRKRFVAPLPADAFRPTAVSARSRIRGEQADPSRANDGDENTWWSSGPGDLAFQPIIFEIDLGKPRIINGLAVVSSHSKGQVRLSDLDVHGGLNGDWDGARPLATVRDATDKTVRVELDSVKVDRLRLRLLGTGRPDNAFAHLAEIHVRPAAGPAKRAIKSTPFPGSPLEEAGHDPDKLRAAIDALSVGSAKRPRSQSLLNAMKERLRLIEEAGPRTEELARISSETEQLRGLNAPEWALAQRDAMARLRNWAHYWIDRQQPDGQFGGGWEDDVELTCGWPVLALAQDDERVFHSMKRLAEGVWKSSPYLERFGYDRLTDVEHAAEKTGYSQPPMVLLEPGNPLWAERCRRTVATMAEFFLSRNERDLIQFRSDYFGFDPKTLKAVSLDKKRPYDIPQSSKALKAALYSVWATGDKDAEKLMLDYGRTWAAAARDHNGADRIAGLLPLRLEWPSGAASGTHAHLASMRATLFHLIGCCRVSGDRAFLEPIRALLEKSVLEWAVKGIPSAGSLGEVRDEDHASLLDQLALVAILYRRASGDTSFDAALLKWSERVRDSLVDGVKSYVFIDRNSEGLWHVDRPLRVGAYRESRCAVGCQLLLGWEVSGDESYLAKLGWNLSSCLNDKWGAFTHWFFDKSERRVFANDHLAHKLQQSESALATMYLGGPAPIESIWPRVAVTWQGGGEDFCALVAPPSDTRFAARLYSFDEQPRQLTARLWELEPGAYEVTVGPDADGDGQPDTIAWRGSLEAPDRVGLRRPADLKFTLPPRTLTAVVVERALD